MRHIQGQEDLRFVPFHAKGRRTALTALSFLDDTFTLETRRGGCAFQDDVFTCGSHVSNPVEFSVRLVTLCYKYIPCYRANARLTEL
jgi:hypothetical protein